MNAQRPRSWALFLVALVLCCAPSVSRGCACCSEEGQYQVDTGKPLDSQIAEMSHIEFGATAQLYLGPGDLLDVKGIRDPSESYVLTTSFDEQRRAWKLVFRDPNARSGMLTLPLKEARMSAARIDIHDGRKSAGGGPMLYKEWKFSGRATGDGVFLPALAKGAAYTLILQGGGNNCDGATDFTHWRLEVIGSRVDFTFVGKIGDDAEAQTEAEEAPGEN